MPITNHKLDPHGSHLLKAALGSSPPQPTTTSSSSRLHSHACATLPSNDIPSRSAPPPSRYTVIYAPAGKKQKKCWKEASLTVSESKAVLFDTTLHRSIASCGAPGAKNPMFDQMAARPSKGFDEGDEIVMNGAWSVQIIAVMHKHLCPYDEFVSLESAAPAPARGHQLREVHRAQLHASPPHAIAVPSQSPQLPSPTPTACHSLRYLSGREPLRTNAEVLAMFLSIAPRDAAWGS